MHSFRVLPLRHQDAFRSVQLRSAGSKPAGTLAEVYNYMRYIIFQFRFVGINEDNCIIGIFHNWDFSYFA